jgi:hypothetical protein
MRCRRPRPRGSDPPRKRLAATTAACLSPHAPLPQTSVARPMAVAMAQTEQAQAMSATESLELVRCLLRVVSWGPCRALLCPHMLPTCSHEV